MRGLNAKVHFVWLKEFVSTRFIKLAPESAGFLIGEELCKFQPHMFQHMGSLCSFVSPGGA